MPIAAGEWQATRHEFRELIERGCIDVAQPDIGRVGGFIEARAICEMARERELIVVPHCWKTAVSLTATAHLAFNTPHCAFIEYLPPALCSETLRRELATEGFRFNRGVIEPPTAPGLGVELDQDALRKYRVA